MDALYHFPCWYSCFGSFQVSLTLCPTDSSSQSGRSPDAALPINQGRMEVTPRMNIFSTAPDTIKAMVGVEAALRHSVLDQGLAELVRLRASQINGCAFCIHMHVNEAIKHGESEMRIHLLNAWRESPLFTDRERAALNWTESLTKVTEAHALDADYELLRAQFNEKEIAYLTILIGAINLWNRVQIAQGAVHDLEPVAAAA